MLRLPAAFERSYGGVLLERPLVVPDAEMRQFADDLVAVFRLLASLPARCFGDDLERFCAALGLEGELGMVMREGAVGQVPLYARADAYHDGTGFRLLEFNVGSELGGIDAAQLNRAFLAADTDGDFAGLEFMDTSAVLADELRRRAPRRASADPVVALVEASGALADHLDVFEAIAEALGNHGLEVRLCEIDQLRVSDGEPVHLGDTKIDVILRYFAADQIVHDGAARDVVARLVAASRAGHTSLFTGLDAGLYASKATLGLLHDPACRDSMTDVEQALVDRIVPWTRNLGAIATEERSAVFDRCVAEQNSLVLKPGVGYGATNTTLGATVSTARWCELLSGAVDADYVVQRIVHPRGEHVIDNEDDQDEPWRANWGVFVTEDGFAGAFVRALRARDGQVISFSNPATRLACVFTKPQRPRVEAHDHPTGAFTDVR